MKRINSPMSEEDARSLRAGETVFLTGTMITARDKAHMRALQMSSSAEAVDIFEGATVYHCGPIMGGDDGLKVIAAGPTTSARMNMLAPRAIRELGIRAIIGKGGMSKETHDALVEKGGVYLAATGGAAVTLAEGIKEVTAREWDDLGMAESVWTMRVKDFGPLVVAMDSQGRSLYDEVEQRVRKNTGL